jgi:accessory gene regulator B
VLQERIIYVKKRFIEYSFRFISKYQPCDELKEKILRYGLETLYNLFSKLFVMLIISIILGIWKEYLLLVLLFASARRYAYGIHAKKSFICWITTLPIYILGCYFIKYVIIPQPLIYVLWIFGFLSFVKWAPADTPSRPLIHAEIRKKQKIKASIICIIYLFCIIGFQMQILSNAIIYCLTVQAICINPITYKLTKTPFDNYKLYYEKHGLNY